MAYGTSHIDVVRDLWARLQHRKERSSFDFDGSNLHIADVASVAYHGAVPSLSHRGDVLEKLQKSVKILTEHLEKGYYIYGVNTGFGGSADSRTEEVVKLQEALMQLTQAGILSTDSKESMPRHSMPPAWVRATMLVRCNATARGHSAVSINTLHAITDLIKHQACPVVPLRGSVSASGDLVPLAYIAGAIGGNPDILIQTPNGRVLPSPQALKEANLSPITLGPKEGLGLVNGTASSAALGALVMEKAHFLAVLTQALTGVAVEALRGSVESFDPFIAQVRPHEGQIQCARNIAHFLQGSTLARGIHDPADRCPEDLIQDRYSLRSAPQWIGPQLEDLLLASRQVTTELNSSCDNPLVDTNSENILYGCNFQAASVTSAMEKTRLSLQMFGRIIFAQVTEMIDPHLSGGLPANLAADDPSLSFALKGVDISMASYMAELSYYANPMSSHVQAAEMHNQSINSMALASGRMTMEAVDILTMMCACSLYTGCQAVDLRVLHNTYIKNVTEELLGITRSVFQAGCLDDDNAAAGTESVERQLTSHVTVAWNATGKKDLRERCKNMVTTALPILLEHVSAEGLVHLSKWKAEANEAAYSAWIRTFDVFCENPTTSSRLGAGSQALYHFVREDLAIPFHRGFVEHPTFWDSELCGRSKKTVGGWISIIHDSIVSGKIYEPLMDVAASGQVQQNGNTMKSHLNGAMNGARNGTPNGALNGSLNGGMNGANGVEVAYNGYNGHNGHNGHNGTHE